MKGEEKDKSTGKKVKKTSCAQHHTRARARARDLRGDEEVDDKQGNKNPKGP